jgi:voltage-gated potassium channel Kch
VHENWSVIDALFFSVTTLTTTGYGNLVPETELGKVFTMLYVLLGAGIIVAFFNLVITGLRMGRERPERREQSDRTAQG